MKNFRTIQNFILVLFILFPLALNAQWERTSFPTGAEVLDIYADGSTVFAGTTMKGLYTSKDNGMTWTQFSEHTVLSYGGFEYLDGKIFCVVGGAGVHVSTDMGTSWKDANTGLNNMNTSTTVQCGGNLFALVLNDGIYRSTDKGASWSKATGSLTAGNSLTSVTVCGNTIYAAQYTKDIYKSTDQGQTWSTVKLADSSPAVFSITSANGVPFVYTIGKGIFYSTDNGQTWSSFKNFTPSEYAYEGGSYFAAGYTPTGFGVFRFKLGDTTFTAMNNGLPQYPFANKLYNTGKYMFAAIKTNGEGESKNGIYRIATSQLIATGVENNTKTRPEKFELMQNYPNPFNPTTTITYSLPEAGRVKLSVFNLLGKEVATLVDEYQDASVHSVNFNAGNLTSGIYLYRLETGKFSAFKKLVLMK